MRRNGHLAVLLLALGLAASAPGAEHPNVARGFQADKVYNFGGVDGVNLYNGNVTLTVPIGQRYGGNGTLSYGQVLSYNSKAWDREIRTQNGYVNDKGQVVACLGVGVPEPGCQLPYLHTMPSRRSNAGMGWLLSLGRLISPYDPMVSGGHAGGPNGWIYESPDGGDHTFYPPTTGAPVSYTKDGSFLRLDQTVIGSSKVSFPDGSVHTFMAQDGAASPRLSEISDPFGNRLLVTYDPAGTEDWTLQETDPAGTALRTHYIRFVDTTTFPEGMPQHVSSNYMRAVREVSLEGFQGVRSVYTFHYKNELVPYQCAGDYRAAHTPDYVVPRLKSVVLPDGSSWTFDYHSAGCSSIRKMAVPTGGQTEWTYTSWNLPVKKCRQALVPGQPFDGEPPFQFSEGVKTKTVSGADFESATWTYSQVPEQLSGLLPICVNYNNESMTGQKHQQSRVVVTAPDGTIAESYFSVWPFARSMGGSDFDESEYGLPFTRSASATGQPCSFVDPDALCLSSRLLVPGPNGGAPVVKQATYVRYEGETRISDDFGEQYRREARRRIVFHEGNDVRWVDTKRSSYDGFGHFRTIVITDSWSNLNKVQTTNYNPGKPSITVDHATWTNTPAVTYPTGKWFLSLFDQQTVSQNGHAVNTEVWFDPNTGFLNRKRALKGTANTRDANDLIAAYTSDSRGNLSEEAYFGGDQQQVGVGALPLVDLSKIAPEYRIKHLYASGTRKSSAYMNGTNEILHLFEHVVDPYTGLIQETADTAGVKTEYVYDTSGRITDVKPAGRASLHYLYERATASVNAKATETLKSQGAVLKSASYVYDRLGRLFTERVSMPGGKTSRREIRYDKLGRRASVSELVDDPWSATLPATLFSYDAVGRPLTITAADGKITSLAYTGAWEQSRTSKRWLGVGTSDSPVTVTEEFDGLGRLTAVREPSGPTSSSSTTGADVRTDYEYDAMDRLTMVKMRGMESVQDRVFDYDGRGLLTWESHPEAGMSSYRYDSRGHVFSSSKGAAQSHFDLMYSYDGAERLKAVKGRNPYHVQGNEAQPPFRPIKEFVYADANDTPPDSPADLRRGKLQIAKRYNYPPMQFPSQDHLQDIILVTETYQYLDAAGRRTHRTTGISKSPDLLTAWAPVRNIRTAFWYDDLDMPVLLSYPRCTGCGYPVFFGLQPTYEQGRLATVPGFVNEPVTYWPNGMRNELKHGNAIVDRQTIDLATMMGRPAAMASGKYDSCTAPVFTVQPQGGRKTSSSPTVRLQVAVTGTVPVALQWWGGPPGNYAAIPGATGTTLDVSPAVTSLYWVVANNTCRPSAGGGVLSNEVTVSVDPDCEPLWATGKAPVAMPNHMWNLDATIGGSEPVAAWYDAATNAQVGTTVRLTVGPVTETRTYHLKLTHACGSDQVLHAVTIEVPLATTSALTAKAVTGMNQILIQWPGSAGAAGYRVERRSGIVWELIADVASMSHTDVHVTAGRTYGYRVQAHDAAGQSKSGYSNADVATIVAFTPTSSSQPVLVTQFNEMLGAVNSARQAVGWPFVTWDNIIAATHPLPGPGSSIRAVHITTCRARMNEALQAMGVPLSPYTDADLVGQPFKVVHVQEIQRRIQ